MSQPPVTHQDFTRAFRDALGMFATGIAVIIAHRPSALVTVDYVAVIQNGRMTNFGKKDDVLPQVRPFNRARPGAIQELTA